MKVTSRYRLFVAPIVLAVMASGAQAAAVDCHAVPFRDPQQKLALARVVAAGPRLNFVAGPGGRTANCPSDSAFCKPRAFLVPGNDVLLSVENGPYVCATFKSPKGVETTGWLPRAALEIVLPMSASAQNWTGTWRRDAQAEIALKSLGQVVKVAGNASSNDDASGAPTVGELDGEARPRGLMLFVGYDPGTSALPPARDTTECAARLRLFGQYLIVEDSGGCGGINVSFTGLYVQAPSQGSAAVEALAAIPRQAGDFQSSGVASQTLSDERAFVARYVQLLSALKRQGTTETRSGAEANDNLKAFISSMNGQKVSGWKCEYLGPGSTQIPFVWNISPCSPIGNTDLSFNLIFDNPQGISMRTFPGDVLQFSGIIKGSTPTFEIHVSSVIIVKKGP